MLSYVFLLVAALLVVGLFAATQSFKSAEPFNNAAPAEGRELNTRYFTRFYIPVVLSVLAIAFLIVLLTMSPGLPLNTLTNNL